MATITEQTSHSQPLKFSAVWTDANKHLEEGFFDKITRCAFSILNNLVKGMVLPASRKSQEFIDQTNRTFELDWKDPIAPAERLLANQFRPTPLEVTTPDGAIIHGTFFKNNAATESSPTVIFFQPNAMLSKQGVFNWVLEQAALQEIPYNFVYFDYRGCAGSEDSAQRANKLSLDGDSIYQFVKDKLHVAANDIHFYGWSLGAGVSAKVKEMHQECDGRYVNERSFTSIIDTIKNICSRFTAYATLNRIIAYAAGFFVSLLSWNIPSANAIENLKGKTLIVHHPEDELMQKEASLYRHFFQRTGVSPSSEISHLDLSVANKIPNFIHGADLNSFANEEFNPKAEIAQFLFGSNLSINQRMIQIFRSSSEDFRNRVYQIVARNYQRGGYYWGSGADACYNRNGQSLTESQLARAIITAKMRA